jgi:hypothetical protein
MDSSQGERAGEIIGHSQKVSCLGVSPDGPCQKPIVFLFALHTLIFHCPPYTLLLLWTLHCQHTMQCTPARAFTYFCQRHHRDHKWAASRWPLVTARPPARPK